MPTVVKLVRDKIPEIMRADGQAVQVRQATNLEKPLYLALKIIEELAEATENPSAEEYCDILQAVYDCAALNGIMPAEIELAREKKLELKGGFSQCLIATYTK